LPPSPFERPAEYLFALGLAAAAAVLLWAGSGLTFFFDEWDLVLNRSGFSPAVFLEPHNDQPFLFPVAIYKVLLNLFGMGSQLPLRIAAVGATTACSILLFVYARRRAGASMALVLTVPVLCLGAGWEAMLLPLSMNFLISLAAGIGMVLALERGDRPGDLAAAGLLIVATMSGGLGLAFVAAALVDITIKKQIRRLWIAGLPLLALGLWTISYGGDGVDALRGANPGEFAGNLFSSLSYATEAISGFSIDRRPWFWVPGVTQPGPVLAVVAIVALMARVFIVRKPVSRSVLIIGAALLTFWILTALTTGGGRQPEASRYQYPGAVLLIAFAVSLLEGLRLPRLLPWICLPLVLYSVAVSVIRLQDGRDFLAEQTAITRSALGVLEIEGVRDLPDLELRVDERDDGYLLFITAGSYFRAIDRYGGSPAYSEVEINSAPDAAKETAYRIRRRIEDERAERDGPPARDPGDGAIRPLLLDSPGERSR